MVHSRFESASAEKVVGFLKSVLNQRSDRETKAFAVTAVANFPVNFIMD